MTLFARVIIYTGLILRVRARLVPELEFSYLWADAAGLAR